MSDIENIYFMHSLHKELWDWLRLNPKKRKAGWPRWEENGGDVKLVLHRCFACSYASSKVKGTNICDVCPLAWPNEDVCPHEDGLWAQWDSTWCVSETEDVLMKRSELAELIRDLPVREYVLTM